jgi:hypothetical protein
MPSMSVSFNVMQCGSGCGSDCGNDGSGPPGGGPPGGGDIPPHTPCECCAKDIIGAFLTAAGVTNCDNVDENGINCNDCASLNGTVFIPVAAGANGCTSFTITLGSVSPCSGLDTTIAYEWSVACDQSGVGVNGSATVGIAPDNNPSVFSGPLAASYQGSDCENLTQVTGQTPSGGHCTAATILFGICNGDQITFSVELMFAP